MQLVLKVVRPSGHAHLTKQAECEDIFLSEKLFLFLSGSVSSFIVTHNQGIRTIVAAEARNTRVWAAAEAEDADVFAQLRLKEGVCPSPVYKNALQGGKRSESHLTAADEEEEEENRRTAQLGAAPSG